MTKPLVKFLPLLLLYTAIILLFSKKEFTGDEGRYLEYAGNLLRGAYTDPGNPVLDTGPGYPLFLTGFVWLDLPLIVPKLFNGIFTFLAVIFFFKTLLFYIPWKSAVLFSYLFGLYYPMYLQLPALYTEPLGLLLICIFLYLMIKIMRSTEFRFRPVFLAVITLAALIYVKYFFGTVVFFSIFLALAAYLIFRTRKVGNLLAVLFFGFLFATPWLVYTYSLTGKMFYWGTNGGSQLYWMSSRYEGEYGGWIYPPQVTSGFIKGVHPSHFALIDSIASKPWVEQNDIFMRIAKENIKKNPRDYLANVAANFLRGVFDAPESYQKQDFKIFFYLLIHMFLIVPLVFSLYPGWRFRQLIPFEIIAMLAFILIYWAGITLVQARPRHLVVVIPFLLLWLAFVYDHFVQVRFGVKEKLK